MPELGEQMYCSQQICIPPTFPYLLRQFAKAAIRSQPNDLLKWSTTYFRCLSLNIPPPVKPRLEYPIPKDYHGMTPGWLRALLQQMQGAQTIPFKLLWDRWIGACLQHPNLIQILCLGGFDDNMAIPWLRFIGLCAAHLTENLTQTMILICEVFTEEPEGGSAMIPVQVFNDLYQFLARIDASIPQTLKNYYFLDKFLELYQEKIKRDAGPKQPEEESPAATLTAGTSEASTAGEKDLKKGDAGSVVSCPSATSQDPDNFMKLLMKIREDELEEEAMEASIIKRALTSEEDLRMASQEGALVDEDQVEPEKKAELAEEPVEESDVSPVKSKASQKSEEEKVEAETVHSDSASRDTKISSTNEELVKCPEEQRDGKVVDKYLLEDLERLKLVQQELMGGESDDELEKYKATILAEAAMTPSQLAAPEHFIEKLEDVRSESGTETIKSDESTVSEPSVKRVESEVEYEDVFVEAVPGIGPIVPEELIAAVCNYMKEMAKLQHNMVMPRNIRHFECPPLEVTNVTENVKLGV